METVSPRTVLFIADPLEVPLVHRGREVKCAAGGGGDGDRIGGEGAVLSFRN